MGVFCTIYCKICFIYILYNIIYIYIHRNITNVPELIDKSY